MNKKGLELSLTVIVLIILSIIIFIGGIALVWKFFAGAEDIKAGIERRTQEQIEALLREGNELVAIPVNTKQVRLGKEVAFGLGIRNIHETQGFSVRLDFAGLYDRKGQELPGISVSPDHIEQTWLGGFQQQENIMIARNKFEILTLRVRAATTVDQGQPTPRGAIAVFNVCVFLGPVQGDCEVQNRDATYDKKIRQLFVETA